MPRAGTLLAAVLLAVVGLRRGFALVAVTGDSMMPALAPGDRVLVLRVGLARLRPGQIAVVERPGAEGYATAARPGPASGEWMIKRVVAVPGDPRPDDILPVTAGPPGPRVPPGTFVVLGDNADWSHDSRHIGYVPGDRLLGQVVRRLPAAPPLHAVPSASRSGWPPRSGAASRART
jgi:signal peptidase I